MIIWLIITFVVTYLVATLLIKRFFPDGGSRDCPHCKARIAKKATICRFCKSNLTTISNISTTSDPVRFAKAKKFQEENLAKIEAKKTNQKSPSNKPLEPNLSVDKQEEIVKPSEKE